MEFRVTNKNKVSSKLLSVRETYEIVLKELEVEKKLWSSAEVTLWTSKNFGMSFEVSDVRLGSIKKETGSAVTECLILQQHRSTTFHVLSGEIKLRSSLEMGQFLEFQNEKWFYIEVDKDRYE